jgi:hypothetical protein
MTYQICSQSGPDVQRAVLHKAVGPVVVVQLELPVSTSACDAGARQESSELN